MSTLPQIAFDILPFSDDPMLNWKRDSDVRVFVNALYNDHPSFSSEIFASEEKAMREFARSFTKNLMEANDPITYIDFYQDAQFGQVAKYAIALECCIQSLLQDAGFYSLAHILETEEDMKCSLLLASNFYYKQATLMLRNILEEVFLPIHFCESVTDYNTWKANNFHTPNLRGKNGLIKQLREKNIIHEPLATRVSNLYGSLSAYVHGSENTLTHHSIHLGEMNKLQFNQIVFAKWCKNFCESIDISIQLLKINYNQWSVIRSKKFEALAKVGKTLCHTCHNEESFDIWMLPSKYIYTKHIENEHETNLLENVEELAFYRYVCQHCGNNTTVNSKETSLTIVVCLSTEELQPEDTITDHAYLVRGTEDPYCEWYTVQEQGKDIVTPLLTHLNN